MTISALRKESDWPAWCYLGLGLAMSVTGNVLHVHPGPLPWPPYAVAAVPPVAAMLALGALLRQVYRLASGQPERRIESPAGDSIGEVPSSVLEAAKASLMATLAAGNPWSVNQLQQQFSLTRAQATKVRQSVLGETNGSGHEKEGEAAPA